MTIPIERALSTINTKNFLYELLDPKKTPRVPEEIRQRARGLLEHFPGDYYLETAAEKCPNIFGKIKNS